MSAELIKMTDKLYDYLHQVSYNELPILAELRAETASDARHTMAISPMQGQFMEILVRVLQPRSIVEVGVYTGYSSLVMSLASSDDTRLWCFDVSEEWTSVARKYWERAGVAQKVDLRLGPATESLERRLADGLAGTIDLIFIDADKGNYWRYWNLGLELLRTGGLIIADNTLFQGMVEPSIGDDEIRSRFADRGPDRSESIVRSTHHLREFNRLVSTDARVVLSVVPVGDGMTLGVKR
jgi:caffeoyl-CoA O-methyltransferase